MTEISSDEIKVNRGVDKVYTFLKDLRNLKNLMPEDVGGFEATEEEAQLDLKGLGKFSISITDQEENKRIKLTPKGKLPFKFDIEWLLTNNGDNSVVVGRINAELNMFMKMMAEPKLRSFLDSQAHKLKDYLESEIQE
ncbi:MAG: SRPBCC family protein [Bacteroidia bacterium]|nr:SRPBCC family protein [Bacteroidia bacterium]